MLGSACSPLGPLLLGLPSGEGCWPRLLHHLEAFPGPRLLPAFTPGPTGFQTLLGLGLDIALVT